MKTLECSEANLPLADYAKKLKKAPVIITKEGKPLAALIEFDSPNADMETVSLSSNPKWIIALIERSRTRQKKEGGIWQHPGNAAGSKSRLDLDASAGIIKTAKLGAAVGERWIFFTITMKRQNLNRMAIRKVGYRAD